MSRLYRFITDLVGKPKAPEGLVVPPNGGAAVVKSLFNTALSFAAVLATAYLIYGGITYIISSGDAQKIKKAQTTMLYAIVGLVLALAAYTVAQFIFKKFGSDAINQSPF